MWERRFARITSALLALVMITATVMSVAITSSGESSKASYLERYDGELDLNKELYYADSAIQRLPSSVKDTDLISVIFELGCVSLLDKYESESRDMEFSDYILTEEADTVRADIAEDKAALVAELDRLGVDYKLGASYDTVISGFEITIVARDFEAVSKNVPTAKKVYVGEVYNPAKTELVENDVDVYETGIFDSSDFAYDGSGIVVAVLDTGLDYYHSAFSLENFSSSNPRLTLEEIRKVIGDTKAATLFSGLKAEDVYVNAKVPYGFDYADFDPDVYPIQSDHGTHVSGIIAGKDDTIVGVAPNAQLVEMKIFSDTLLTAKTSWILSAVEDCVKLGVDVINMSIGTGCGFSRENDKELESGVYQKVRDAGISLIVAASNSFNSTYGSEKNGNLGLTSNPDSATVGSPSTYEGALSIASVNGVKTPYILYDGTIVYFTESTDRVSEEKNFFDEILPAGVNEKEFEFVTIPGAGRSADYSGIDVEGKIVLVRRGSSTFEEKANVAKQKNAAGIIIYNNVSGEIKMTVGDADIPVCSIRQDDGEMLAAVGSGTLKISRSQKSGPFMSDFSSWGPTPDLGIKPEITAHGGSILSAVPGQSYDRISGTSMATPNMSGVVALLRQYVKNDARFAGLTDVEITATINRLLMSTADIIYNTNGLPYAVRKQGAGLASLDKSAATNALIITYGRADGSEMSASKIELGDDPSKSGVYTLKFSVYNFGSTSLTYDVSAIVMTEGVSDTKTHNGDTTVTEQGYLLSGASIKVTGTGVSGSTLTVGAGKTEDVTVTITLSASDKKYLDESFKNGMYVEGFVKLDDKNEQSGVDLSAPYLGFYGDWTVAPLFDIDYYETNADELDDSIDTLDKTLPDAYATRPVGVVENDYVSFLGAFYFEQDPSSKLIAADRKYISLSNQVGTVHELGYVWGGLLRGAKEILITITEDATGEVVFERVEKDVRKSYGDGGSIYPANIDIGFDAIEQNLKNNTKYTVKLSAKLDYGDGGVDTNLNNTFEFPLTTDFTAPAVTDCEFYTEYDRSAKKTRLYAKMAVYDNHYAMAMQVGYVGMAADGSGYVLNTFDKYLTTVYSEYNSTTYVVYELTDYVDTLKANAVSKNTFTVACYDYALNVGTYEIGLPDDFTDFYFENSEITLSPNQTMDLTPLVYPNTEWPELLNYKSLNEKVAVVREDKLVAVAPGVAAVRVSSPTDNSKETVLTVRVLAEGDEGFVKYDKPVAESFKLTGFYVNNAYYYVNSNERDIGSTGDEQKFAGNRYSLKMFPSEAVTLRYDLKAYFPKTTEIVFTSGNEDVVKIDSVGKITAVAEGYATVYATVYMDGAKTYYSQSVSIEVKDPYVTSGPSLTHYFGNGGVVEIPKDLAITDIGQFAFSNFDYIPKDENDIISDEEPETMKVWYKGQSTATAVIIPEGVKTINNYAFAGITTLERVVLPSTLERIDWGAFYGCTALKEVVGLENVKFINQGAFYGCDLTGSIELGATAIADYAFAGNKNLKSVTLSESTQSVANYAFYGNSSMESFNVNAPKLKLGLAVFGECSSLTEIDINAAVIPANSFYGCTSLEKVTLGADVAVIDEYAFARTKVSAFTVDKENTVFKSTSESAPYVLNAAGDTLLLASPAISGTLTLPSSVKTISRAAFSGNANLTEIIAPGVKRVEDYAFADCKSLESVSLGTLEYIGSYAFAATALKVLPSFSGVSSIGDFAFSATKITEVVIPNGFTVGEGAFRDCFEIESVTIGDNVKVGVGAFRVDHRDSGRYELVKMPGTEFYTYKYLSNFTSLTIGKNVEICSFAFLGASALERVELGEGAIIGSFAFFNAASLTEMDLSKVVSIGEGAFYGDILNILRSSGDIYGNQYTEVMDEYGNYRYAFYSAKFTELDLSSLTEISKLAFAYCESLERVTVSDKLVKICDSAFEGCTSLKSIDLSGVKHIGDYAFSRAKLDVARLYSAEYVGKYAFVYNDRLEFVLFTDPAGEISTSANVTVSEGAFAQAENLHSVQGMSRVSYFGDYSFAHTNLTNLDLTSATYIGQSAFIKSYTDVYYVTLGDKLTDIADNPFANCRINVPFSSVVTETFNGKEFTTTVYTFDVSESIRVINGSLYKVVPDGFELIVYAGNDESVSVAEGTVRIAAYAFAGTQIKEVNLPSTLRSIGHKAFFGCTKLATVVFKSYNAPILEEEYDLAYCLSGENIPATGEFQFQVGNQVITYRGLGIVPYFMWNASQDPATTYYGANFVNYVGRVDTHLTMVYPKNGKNYDSFIYGQYFSTMVEGSFAADEVTLGVIELIGSLPEKVALSDKELVLAARAAYEKISSAEQRVLVTNYQLLVQAEKRIENLEYLAGGQTPPADEPSDEPSDEPTDEPTDTPADGGQTDDGKTVEVSKTLAIILCSAAGVSASIGIGFAVMFFITKGKLIP